MIIDNFENMTENKLVEVTFKKLGTITNPLTGNPFIRLTIMSIPLVGVVLFAKKRRIASTTK